MIKAKRVFKAIFAAAILVTAATILITQGEPVRAEVTGAAREGALPANPVHSCTKQNDGTDTTKWSYVYFGSYPQSEVTGSALTAEITEASYDANGDAWVNGTKYRRISKNNTNNADNFGSGTYRYFKWERLKWRVLKVNGSSMFVMADKGLDCKCYHDTPVSVLWKTSTLRSWLNNSFCGTAFNIDEQKAIIAQTVVSKDENGNIISANNTLDKIFILSNDEAANTAYGFCGDLAVLSASRVVKVSDYAYARGAGRSSYNNIYEDEGTWWLRSPGVNRIKISYVSSGANWPRWIADVNSTDNVCVPVMHISLSSDLWSVTDDGTSGAGGEDPGKRLEDIKKGLKEDLETYKDASNYREAQKEDLAAAITMGQAAIDAAADEIGAKLAHADAKTMIDRIKTDADLTEEENQAAADALIRAKEKSKQELDEYKNESDYRDEQIEELEAAIEAGKTAIDAAENEEDVNSALVAAKAVIDQIKTDMQLTLEEQKGAENADTDKTEELKGTSIKGKIKAKPKAFLVKWKKQKDITGYQIQYSPNKKFKKKGTKIKTVKKASATKLTVKKLKAKKKYFVRIRTYKIINNTNCYSKWSKARTVKTKK